MIFRRSGLKDWSLLDTAVENIFINEYMINAPGDYTKVYLYGLMCSEIGMDITNEVMAMQMNIREETISNAWEYWEQRGVVRRSIPDPGDDDAEITVEFLSLKEAMYGMGEDAYEEPQTDESKPDNDATEALNMIDEDFRSLCQMVSQTLGRPLTQQELAAINSWIGDYQVTHEVILYAYTYCKNINKDHYKYVGAVVHKWAMEGLRTAEDVEEYLGDRDQRHNQYRRILKALGFARNYTEKEKALMDSWLDDLGFSMEDILKACGKTSGIPNPNMNYVNKILTNWAQERAERSSREDGPVSVGQVMKYYEHLRDAEETAAEMRRREVYAKVPEIGQIDRDLAEIGASASKVMLSGRSNRQELLADIKARSEELEVKKAWLMTEHGFEPDYMERRYKCDICADTGVDDEGNRCRCFSERMQETAEWLRSKNKG